jgi:hypothetical protein
MPDSSPPVEPASRLARWRALPPGDRRRLALLAALMPVVDLSLRALGVRRTRRWLDRVAGHPIAAAATAARLDDAHRLASLAAFGGRRGLYPNTCLRQALLVQWLLRRQGLPARLRMGALLRDGALDAHAWVELDGVPLSQPGLRHAAFDDPDDALG